MLKKHKNLAPMNFQFNPSSVKQGVKTTFKNAKKKLSKYFWNFEKIQFLEIFLEIFWEIHFQNFSYLKFFQNLIFSIFENFGEKITFDFLTGNFFDRSSAKFFGIPVKIPSVKIFGIYRKHQSNSDWGPVKPWQRKCQFSKEKLSSLTVIQSNPLHPKVHTPVKSWQESAIFRHGLQSQFWVKLGSQKLDSPQSNFDSRFSQKFRVKTWQHSSQKLDSPQSNFDSRFSPPAKMRQSSVKLSVKIWQSFNRKFSVKTWHGSVKTLQNSSQKFSVKNLTVLSQTLTALQSKIFSQNLTAQKSKTLTVLSQTLAVG